MFEYTTAIAAVLQSGASHPTVMQQMAVQGKVNAMREDGWEPIAVTPVVWSKNPTTKEVVVQRFLLTFKRPAPAPVTDRTRLAVCAACARSVIFSTNQPFSYDCPCAKPGALQIRPVQAETGL